MADLKNGTDPFAEGHRAQLDGVPLPGCPYPQDSDAYVEWCAGWHGKQAAEPE